MISVDVELVRQVQDEREGEAAAHRLACCVAGNQSSRPNQWRSFPAARELLSWIRDFVGFVANRAESQVPSGVPQ